MGHHVRSEVLRLVDHHRVVARTQLFGTLAQHIREALFVVASGGRFRLGLGRNGQARLLRNVATEAVEVEDVEPGRSLGLSSQNSRRSAELAVGSMGNGTIRAMVSPTLHRRTARRAL